VLGHLGHLARDPLCFFTQCYREYGNVVALRLGTWPTLLISNPKLMEYVLVKDHRNFVKNRFFWRQVTAVFGNGLLTSEGDFWHRQRRLAAPAFTGQRLARYGEVTVRQAQRMLAGWEIGQERDLHADMMGLTLRIAAILARASAARRSAMLERSSLSVLVSHQDLYNTQEKIMCALLCAAGSPRLTMCL
jgi:cytochrome P450